MAILLRAAREEKPAARFLKWKTEIIIARITDAMDLITRFWAQKRIAAQILKTAGPPAAIAVLACARFLRAANRYSKDALLRDIPARRDMRGLLQHVQLVGKWWNL